MEIYQQFKKHCSVKRSQAWFSPNSLAQGFILIELVELENDRIQLCVNS
jgi:hypothetical protein